jgi:hypothetical protein
MYIYPTIILYELDTNDYATLDWHFVQAFFFFNQA